jgi:hypothetical protein
MAVPALKGLKGSAVAEIPKVLGRMDENPVAAARAFGDKVRPSDMAKAEPETSVKTTRATEGVAGSRQLRISLMEHNAKNGTSKAAIDLGGTGNEPRITQKFLDEKSAPHLATYRKVGRAAGDFDSANPSLKADLYAIADREGLHPDARADAAKAISEYSDRAMSGPDTVKSISTLRREAARNGRSDDPNMQAFGFTQRKIADAIEAQLGRQLEASGQAPLMQEFAGARQGLAKIHDVDTALKGGQVDRHVLLRLRNQGVPLTGNLAIMADSADMFKHVTKHPTSIADEGGGGVVPGIGHSKCGRTPGYSQILRFRFLPEPTWEARD